MPNASHTILIPAESMRNRFREILVKYGFDEDRAALCAEIFTNNSLDGVYTHGVNRFAKFVSYTSKGYIRPNASPVMLHSLGAIERWDANLGPGPLNASFACNRAMELARQSGIGCVALSNSNHWMRGGSYGWQAASAGFGFIGWTNTIANMPTWGATDSRLGNNPLVLAIPYEKDGIVLDMAMSQYSYGAMELAMMKGEELPVFGGFDKDGQWTKHPASILASKRPVPIGYWKGAGLSLLLDMMAVFLSGGLAVHDITARQEEYGLSQIFIAFRQDEQSHAASASRLLEKVIMDYKQSIPVEKDRPVRYPGERVLITRADNTARGIPVLASIWEEILKL